MIKELTTKKPIDFADLIGLAGAEDDAHWLATRGTVSPYSYETGAFVAFLKDTHQADPAAGLVAYVEEIRQRDYSAATVNKRLAAAKLRVRQLIDVAGQDLTAAQLARLEACIRKLKPLKRDARPSAEKFFTKDEARVFLAGCADVTAGLVFEFMARTGLRISECLGLKLRALKLTTDGYTISFLGKGSKERTIFPPRELTEKILAHFHGTTYLFEHSGRKFSRVSITNRIRRASLAVLGRGVSAHACRHSYATWKLEAGTPIELVSDLLGHASISTTNSFYRHNRASRADAEVTL